MSWSIGYDDKWKRDIGYGVPAYCDHPGCNEQIDRGLAHVCCDQEPYGGDRGCGLYFCEAHQHSNNRHSQLCARCFRSRNPFKPKPEHPEWIGFKLTDESWKEWRESNPTAVARLRKDFMRTCKSCEQLPGSDRNMPGKQDINNPDLRVSHFLGESWSFDELHNAKHVFSAICEGVDASLTVEEMRALEKRGLVTDIEEGPKRGCKAGRYKFMWTDKLEHLVAALRAQQK